MALRVAVHDTQRSLGRPVSNAHDSWSQRAGCILTLESEDGVWGQGEASPLPGFSPDTLDECRAALSALDPTLLPERLEPGMKPLVELMLASARLPSKVPAAKAALEAALLDRWSRATARPAWALLVPPDAPPPEPRRVAALLSDLERALPDAELAFARGVRCFKLKVGRPDATEQELAAARALGDRYPQDVALRLDANRAWSGETALEILPRFAALGIELVEEPCELTELPQLTSTGLVFALDESLLELDARRTTPQGLRGRGVGAVVLKPTLLGGLSACVAWAKRARASGAAVIVSHAFEGPLGLTASACLALGFGSLERAQGLDSDALPALREARIEPWSRPGFGLERQA